MVARDPAQRSQLASERARKRWGMTSTPEERAAGTEAARRAAWLTYEASTPPAGSHIDPAAWSNLDPAGRRTLRMRELARRAAAIRREARLAALRDAA